MLQYSGREERGREREEFDFDFFSCAVSPSNAMYFFVLYHPIVAGSPLYPTWPEARSETEGHLRKQEAMVPIVDRPQTTIQNCLSLCLPNGKKEKKKGLCIAHETLAPGCARQT